MTLLVTVHLPHPEQPSLCLCGEMQTRHDPVIEDERFMDQVDCLNCLMLLEKPSP